MTKEVTPRTTRACKICRSLKVRCLPSEDVDLCQKCLRSGTECVFDEQRPRKKREKPDSRARVTALENKIEDLIAQVQASKNSPEIVGRNGFSDNVLQAPRRNSAANFNGTSISGRLDIETFLPTPESRSSDQYAPSATQSPSHTPRSQSNLGLQQLPLSSREDCTPEALINGSHLSVEAAAAYLDKFRNMCSYFPFVIIPIGSTVQSLLQNRPILLHAALSVACSSDVLLQQTLEKSFRSNILTRVMLEGERSIDLLQGLLIYLAWGQFFVIPKKEQSYQMLQMAVSLCIDMGLNLRPAEAKARKVGLQLEHYHQAEVERHDAFFSREARRAYLGCYHLSADHNWVWAKPNNVPCTDYLLDCAASLTKKPEYSTDELILPLTQLHQIGNEYHGIFCTDKFESNSHLALDRMEMHSRSFQKRAQDFLSSLSSTQSTAIAINLAYRFMAAHVYEMDLLSPFIRIGEAKSTSTTFGHVKNSDNSPIRINILLDCLQSAINFLDHFLSLSWTEYQNLSVSQWSGLTYSVVIIYRLSIGTPKLPFWDVQVARDTVKLELYLEALCYRMQNITKTRLKPGSRSHDLFSVMGLIFENVKNTYEKLRKLPQAVSSNHADPVHETSFPDIELPGSQGHETLPVQSQSRIGYQSRCPAFQFWGKSQSHDIQVAVGADGISTTVGEDPFLGMHFDAGEAFWNEEMPGFDSAEPFTWTVTET